MTARGVLAVVAALLVSVQVVRNAGVEALSDTSPAAAARLWASHPASEIASGMTEIATASKARRAVPQSAIGEIFKAADKEPLSPEPFLVRGVQAQLEGDFAAAQRAFEAAQWRDPRSLPAAYFLADRYVRSGDTNRGLREIAALGRLSPDGGARAIPYITQYAANSRNWPALRRLFRDNPHIAQPVLVALASDVGTIPAALALSEESDKGNSLWLATMVDTLVKAGDYNRARTTWQRLAGQNGGNELIHDIDFHDASTPPPFNWRLTSSTVGLAERQPGGRLHILFYGDEDGTLATQLVMLSPGPYRVTMKLAGDATRAHSLTWSLWCDKAPLPFTSITLDAAAARGWQFEVPAGCAAQWLKLSGTSADVPQQVDISLGRLAIVKATPRV